MRETEISINRRKSDYVFHNIKQIKILEKKEIKKKLWIN